MSKQVEQVEAHELMAQQEQKRVAKLKYELALRDMTQADIASQCGVEPTTVGAVIHGRSRSKKVELRIAIITRLPLAELWPQWHGPNAKPRRRRTSSTAQTADALRAAAG